MLKEGFDDSLFFDVRGRSEQPFQVYIGGRGVGKTYSALRMTRLNKDGSIITKPNPYEKFMYVRRLGKEIELTASEISNPYKRINRDYGTNVTAEFNKKEGYSCFFDSTVEHDGDDLPIIGYATALSTFSGLRGVDFSDVTTLIFDEFITETHVRKIKNEGKVFLNMYETINRNRELQGEEPLKVMLLANSISLASGILLEMGAVPTIASMIAKGQHRATLKERGLYVELVDSSKLAEYKEQTALYRLTDGSDFSKEAIMNQFTSDNLNLAKKVAINEYQAVFNFTDYTYYKHKTRDEYYLAKRHDVAKTQFESGDVDRLIASFTYVYERQIISRKLAFDDYATKLVFDSILGLL